MRNREDLAAWIKSANEYTVTLDGVTINLPLLREEAAPVNGTSIYEVLADIIIVTQSGDIIERGSRLRYKGIDVRTSINEDTWPTLTRAQSVKAKRDIESSVWKTLIKGSEEAVTKFLESFTLVPSASDVTVGDVVTFTFSDVLEDGADTSGITLTSSDELTATVSGLSVTTLLEGSVTITASDAGISSESTITINPIAE